MHPSRRLPAVLLLVAACGDGGGADTGGWTEAEAGAPAAPGVRIEWGDEALRVTVTGGPGAYELGLAEVVDCGESCWTGEDCLWGWRDAETGDETAPTCHAIPDDGVLLLYYGGDRASLQPGHTALTRAHEGRLAFYLESDVARGGSGACWTFGAESAHYEGLGCVPVTPAR